MSAWLFYNILTTAAEEIAIGIVGLWLLPRFGVKIPPWAVAVVMAGWLGWSVYGFRKGIGPLNRRPADVVGAKGSAVTRLDPEGQVKVQGEIWRARADQGTIEPGTPVEVIGRQGLTLTVRTAGSGEGSALPVDDADNNQH